MSNTTDKPGVFSRINRYFLDMVGELKKVVWPSKKQILNNFAIVLSFLVIASVCVAGFDALLKLLLGLIFGTVGV